MSKGRTIKALRLKADPASPPIAYTPTEAELAAVRAQDARAAGRAPVVPLKVIQGASNEGATVQVNHKDSRIAEKLFREQLATDSEDFATAATAFLGNLSIVNGQVSEKVLNSKLAVVRAIAPKDELETLLAMQMVAIHSATLNAAMGHQQANSIEQREAYERSLNRLSRTFTTQLEALKRYRSKGEQRVVVEHQHVHVYPGGQAVVGNVTQHPGGGVAREIEDQPHERDERLRVSERSPMLSTVEALGLSVSGASDDGQEDMPVPRVGRRGSLRVA